MQYRTLGKTNMSASAVALGTWAIGGGPWWGDSDDNQSIKAIQAAMDAGVSMIDTAPAYGWGHSEEVVGKALKGRRDKVVLSTKCGLWWKDERGSSFFEMGDKHVKRCLLPETADAMYQAFVTAMGKYLPVATGTFQAMMEVELINDGPVTLLIDSTKEF